MSISFAFVNPEGYLLEEIANDDMKQKDVALTYAMAMSTPDRVDWAKVNHAILDRWSITGLKRVKTMAWKFREGR